MGTMILCLLGTTCARSQSAKAGTDQKPQMSEEAFKNVQLLKGIPVDEFMGAMGLFSAALSMCCLECHAPDWAADTPRKRTTRKMIQMVNTINRTNFSGRKVVSCWTCHRQSDRPQVTPTLDVVYGEPIYYAPDDYFQQTPGAPKPDEVLDKYIQAVGGAERMKALHGIAGNNRGMTVWKNIDITGRAFGKHELRLRIPQICFGGKGCHYHFHQFSGAFLAAAIGFPFVVSRH